MSEKTSKILDSLLSLQLSQDSCKETLAFIDASLSPDEKISKETAISQQKRLFLQKSKRILEHYRPQHEKLCAISKISLDFSHSLDKIEHFFTDLQFRDRLLLSKLRVYQEKDAEIQEKKRILANLLTSCSISAQNLELLVNETTNITANFFEALSQLDQLQEIKQELAKISQENQGLHASLEKNLEEIKHLALSKLVRHLNRNLESIDTQFIIKSLQLLRNHQDLYQKFLKNYLKHRKFVNSQRLDPFSQSFIEPVAGLKALFKEFLAQLSQEIEFLQGVFREDLKRNEFLDAIFNESLQQILANLEKFVHQDDFSAVFEICMISWVFHSDLRRKLDEKDLEKSHLLQTSLSLSKQAENFVKKSLISLSQRLLLAKFNLQNPNSYKPLEDFLRKAQELTDFQLKNQEILGKDVVFGTELLAKPVLDLANSKVQEYRRATQPLIFAVNVYELVCSFFGKYESFKEKGERISSVVKEFVAQIAENLHAENTKKLSALGFEGDSLRNLGKILQELAGNHDFSAVLRDTELFLGLNTRKEVEKLLIQRFWQELFPVIERVRGLEIKENCISKENFIKVFGKADFEDNFLRIPTKEELLLEPEKK